MEPQESVLKPSLSPTFRPNRCPGSAWQPAATNSHLTPLRYPASRHSNDINVTDVQFLGQRGDSGGQGQAAAPEEYQEAEADLDLPF